MFKKLFAFLAAMTVAVAFAAVDVNKATPAELDGIKGIGPGISGKIVDERKKGNFKSWDDLIERVKGVGEGNAAKFSTEGLTVGGAGYKGAAASVKAGAKPIAAASAATPGKADVKPATATVAPAAAASVKADTKPVAPAAAVAAAPAMAKDEKKDAKAEAKLKKEADAKAKADEKSAKKDADAKAKADAKAAKDKPAAKADVKTDAKPDAKADPAKPAASAAKK